ncbi:MAG: FtsW/RodA/SpoVE family cell cycle protein [Patescibacteria group bacterium]|nr:MAG: FtsW/RodA/SpoVE family cell cycle protein [Patescibacteria group bacterium]
MRRLLLFFRKIDWLFIGPIVILISFGLSEIYSMGLGQGQGSFIERQLIFAGFGLLVFFILAGLDYHHVSSYHGYLYLGALFLLLAVLFFGQTISGTKGWFGFFGLGIQPVEFAKLALLIFLARYFSKVSPNNRPLKHLFITGGAAASLIFLVLLQPDFGSAMVLFFLWFLMIIAAGFKFKYILSLILIGLLLFSIAWQFSFKDYQKQRVMTFLSPASSSADYNVRQAIIAVGAGGLYGRGLGFGSQSQLRFLPEANTDFIFAVIAEELGFIGVLVVLACFGLIFYRLASSVPRIRSYFGSLVIVGGAGLIFLQMFVNIGMNMGILPVVGLPLPFVSYGGSSLITGLAMAGIMQSIMMRATTKR